MAIKLGDLLVRGGVITPDQLEHSLRNQQIFGGRLGTNLVELGYVSETQLALELSKQLGVQAADPKHFSAIPGAAIAAVPRELAEKHRVVPLAVDDRALTLAMWDPTDLGATDEISFSTGLRVTPVVAPEILIAFALETYYGVRRDTRYLRVAGASGTEFQVVQTATWQEQLGEAAPSNVALKSRSEFFSHAPKDFKSRGVTLAQMCKTIASATSHDDVFEAVVQYANQHFRHVVLFVPQVDNLVAWTQRGADIDFKELRVIVVPVMQSPLFHGVWRTRVPFAGTPMLTEPETQLFQRLSLPAKRPLLCVPVPVNSRPFCTILCVDPGQHDVADYLQTYNTLATKVSYASQMLFFRRRILT